MTVKAIETVYKGYKFRSRLEARWAIVFDSLGLEWEYEKQGYDLAEHGLYLPDFSIQTKDGLMWFGEVKGDLDNAEAMAKVHYLDDYPPNPYMGVIVLNRLEASALKAQMLGVSEKEYNNAIIKAKQARFEHGEQNKNKK